MAETGEISETTVEQQTQLDPQKVGMICLIISEAVLFMTLVLVYLFYLDKSRPVSSVHLGAGLALLGTVLLLGSSGTVHLAEKALQENNASGFRQKWLITICAGIGFLVCTGIEWSELIEQGYGIDSGFFGSTYFTLVGFHAFHVTVGVLLMLSYYSIYSKGEIPEKSHKAAVLISWYWHFVDVVWIIVLFVVYGLGGAFF